MEQRCEQCEIYHKENQELKDRIEEMEIQMTDLKRWIKQMDQFPEQIEFDYCIPSLDPIQEYEYSIHILDDIKDQKDKNLWLLELKRGDQIIEQSILKRLKSKENQQGYIKLYQLGVGVPSKAIPQVESIILVEMKIAYTLYKANKMQALDQEGINFIRDELQKIKQQMIDAQIQHTDVKSTNMGFHLKSDITFITDLLDAQQIKDIICQIQNKQVLNSKEVTYPKLILYPKDYQLVLIDNEFVTEFGYPRRAFTAGSKGNISTALQGLSQEEQKQRVFSQITNETTDDAGYRCIQSQLYFLSIPQCKFKIRKQNKQEYVLSTNMGGYFFHSILIAYSERLYNKYLKLSQLGIGAPVQSLNLIHNQSRMQFIEIQYSYTIEYVIQQGLVDKDQIHEIIDQIRSIKQTLRINSIIYNNMKLSKLGIGFRKYTFASNKLSNSQNSQLLQQIQQIERQIPKTKVVNIELTNSLLDQFKVRVLENAYEEVNLVINDNRVEQDFENMDQDWSRMLRILEEKIH